MTNVPHRTYDTKCWGGELARPSKADAVTNGATAAGQPEQEEDVSDINVAALIRDCVDRGERDADVVSRKVVGEIISQGAAEDVLFGLVHPQAVSVIRAIEAAVERKWEQSERANNSAQRRGHNSESLTNEATKARQELMRTSFYAPGFGKIAYGTAKIIHHEAARDHSLGIASKYTTDAGRHDKIIQIIRDAGVTCLDEVPGYSDADLYLQSWASDPE